MQTEQTAALTNTPAIVLALVLLGAMAVASVQVAQYVLLAPGHAAACNALQARDQAAACCG